MSSFKKGFLVNVKTVLTFFILFAGSAPLFPWPSPTQWFPVLKNGEFLQDPPGDAAVSRDVVGDSTYPAAYIYNDGAYIYFRLRLNSDPTGTGQSLLRSFGWGVLFDTNLNAADYEWMFMVDGISKPEIIGLWQNTVQGTLGSPTDPPEILVHSIPVSGNIQISLADSNFSNNPDYFLDWRFPYNLFKQYTGITDNAPLRLFFGSSPSANTLREQGGDLVGASDLYAGFSDYITPFGAAPTTGTIRFVADIAGNGDVEQECIGNTLYIRVDDKDQNSNPTAINTVTITLSVPGGDSETLTLMETGVNTGVFTGSIPLTYGPPASGDGVFQAEVNSIITATYIDAIDANLLLNQPRTDTLLVCGPIITVIKEVLPGSVASGGTVEYKITINNTGTGPAIITQIQDTLPTGFSYVSGTTFGLTTDNPNINGQILTWNGMWQVPAEESRELIFNAFAGSVSGTYFNNVAVSGNNFPTFFTGDTAPVTVGAPLMEIVKTVDKNHAEPGEEITYTLHYRNIGDGAATNLVIIDTVPFNTTYVPGSLRIGTADTDYSTAAVLTDADDGDEGHITGSTIIFKIPSVAPDDGVPGSGDDEGKVYFKVTVD